MAACIRYCQQVRQAESNHTPQSRPRMTWRRRAAAMHRRRPDAGQPVSQTEQDDLSRSRHAEVRQSLGFIGVPRPALGAAAHDGSGGALDLGREILEGVRVGIAHHLGWAVAVTASAGHEVVDRPRVELIEPGMPAAPVEHAAKALDGDASAKMVAEVRASALRATWASLDELAASLPEPIVSSNMGVAG